MERCKTVDPRQPRVGQAITGTVLAVGFVAGWPIVMPILAVVLALASLVGGPFNPYVYAYRSVKRVLRWGSPGELEEAAPPRFANTLGFAFLTSATILYYPFHLHA